ncbi:COX15/CtaA family protein [Uliginosibacterium sp. H1]|uniref:COX15/CtaA family protein n=1 Tax=Uliginosibacterium sp. H1 TaxID=3114757 RepID=UPI002E181C9F|nr:COX15/CtaA family protein [Uliginosibacterium sp. H1]
MLRKLIALSLLLTAIVVVLGAYVRLSDAGLGCPDWPGCYGQLSPHHAEDEIRAAHAAEPYGPVSMPKAWKEMIHRYLASTLGFLIIAIAWLSWRASKRGEGSAAVAIALVGVVIFQGLLGKWTVTLLLKPAIVTLHLLGGLTVLGMLTWLFARARGLSRQVVGSGMALAARVALVLLVVQITLGGWVSTNYAALACTDLPTCHGEWLPQMDVGNAFHVLRELGMTAEGDLLSREALTAIHFMHRVGAVVAGLYLIVFGLRLRRLEPLRGLGNGLVAAVVLQIALGIANVLLSLPLPLAVAHNAGAALLIVLTVTANYRLRAAEPVRASSGVIAEARG